ncbi:MAG: Gfo/Idh/MocA family oxidoreductase [Elusimicrobia bacterium]|nr:Gfo/Idh/MocA family oxidoreductase [Elusimicrobiota bacterium]
MEPVIVVVGAGQLGSRHLQALALMPGPVRLFVLEPSAEARARAESRYAEVRTPSSPLPRFLDHASELPAVIDAAVIATNADARLAALKTLLNGRRVRHVILEKVLFPTVAELDEAGDLLDRATAQAWVNCPRRLWPVYREMKALLGGKGPLTLDVAGPQWGLGSNAVHFLDLFQYLTGTTPDLDASGLDAEPVASKRPGFLELTGTLRGSSPAGALSLTSTAAGLGPVRVRIDAPGISREIDEAGCGVPQSRLTHLPVQDLLATGACGLTPYKDSAELHRRLLPAYLAHFRRRSPETVACPIT